MQPESFGTEYVTHMCHNFIFPSHLIEEMVYVTYNILIKNCFIYTIF